LTAYSWPAVQPEPLRLMEASRMGYRPSRIWSSRKHLLHQGFIGRCTGAARGVPKNVRVVGMGLFEADVLGDGRAEDLIAKILTKLFFYIS